MATETSNNSVKKLEEEARDFISSGNSPGYMMRSAGSFIMFQREAETPIKTAYICPSCKVEKAEEIEPVKPYTLTCSSCEHEIFKQEKKKGKKKKG